MPLTFWVDIVACGLSAAMAVIVFRKDPTSLSHPLFSVMMLLLAAESLFGALGVRAGSLDGIVFWQRIGFIPRALLPGTAILFSLVYSRGNYQLFLAKWWPTLVAFWGIPLLLLIGFFDALIADGISETGAEQVAFGFGWSGVGIHGILLLGGILTLMNLERTFSASIGTMRWRVKLVILGLGILFAVRIYTSSQALLYRSVAPFTDGMDESALIIACFLIGVSVLRTRVFGIEVYPSHVLLERSLTVLLSGLYLLIVGLLAKVLSFLGEADSFPVKALFVLVSLVLLSLVLVSDRFRSRLQLFVSQHLRRSRYDYRLVWRTFTERTSRHLDQAAFCEAVVRWGSETFNALSVTLWLVDGSKQRFILGASTAVAGVADLGLTQTDASRSIAMLGSRPDPIDLDQAKESWVEELRAFNPDFFKKGGGHICVPLAADGELIGLMTLSDRVSGVPFTSEDLELLKSIGEQSASSLLNIQLSRRLAELREMEAFQTMSTFFVHDLKNVASTLSLMLTNLPIHFDNPAFREDALKAVSKSVGRINDLIGCLTELRSGMGVKLVEADLNVLAESALEGLAAARPGTFAKNFERLPVVMIDPQQAQKVITNLLLNALDAIGEAGEIRLTTARREGWAVLSVSDNGCGISRDFLERGLFRPFQTTKKKGMGIGMYHSKMIVDAHKGRIEVESKVGKGTTFRVLFPLPGASPGGENRPKM